MGKNGDTHKDEQMGHSELGSDHVHHIDHDKTQQYEEHYMSQTEMQRMTDHTSHDTGGQHMSHDHHAMMVSDYRKRFFISLVLTIPVLILSPTIQVFFGLSLRFPGDSYLLFALSTINFFYGGWPFLKGAREELIKKSPAMMTLIALAITVAYFYSLLTVFVLTGTDFFWELATLITIMLLGHWIEMRSIMGASRALEELARLMPENAHVINANGETMDIPVNHLKAGDHILVKPGEKIPIDGVVYDGGSSVNESMITGESTPVFKSIDDEVIGGSINSEGIIMFTVSKTGDDTFISQVIKLVREAQASKSRTQRLADLAAKWLFYIAVTAGTTTFITWLGIGKGLGFAMERAVTVMVIACPHALGLAVPLVTSVSTSIAAKHGLLIRNRAAFENARNLDVVLFDKTGTLTESRFGVTDIQPIGISENELLEITYAVEANSEHPIAQGIVGEAKKRGLQLKPVSDYISIPGQGLKANVDGREILIGSPGYMRILQIFYDEAAYSRLAAEGKTVIFVLVNQKLAGFIALSDIIRASAKPAIDILRSMGVAAYMLTGDNRKTADYVAGKLGIDHVFAEVLPSEKAQKVDEVRRFGKKVAMTGDGVNDAPALAKADLGIAIGAGTDVAIETADIILVKSNPQDVVNILSLSRATYRKMIQNLAWATGYNIIALPLAAGVLYSSGILLSPALGAVFMSLSTIIVAINARLLNINNQQSVTLNNTPPGSLPVEQHKSAKSPLLWVSLLIVSITIILTVFSFYNWLEFINIDILGVEVHHWFGYIGTSFIAVFTPIFSYLKKRFRPKYQMLLQWHVFGDLIAFMLISIHFAHHLSVFYTIIPHPGTGVPLYIGIVLLVVTGILMRYQFFKKSMRKMRTLHIGMMLAFYLIIGVHIIRGLGVV